MPVTSSTSVATTRLANTAFTKWFWPRTYKSVWPRLCGTTKSHSMFEPFAFLGAVPLLKYYTGKIDNKPVNSFSQIIPNPLWKNFESYRRPQLEFDQTKTFQSRVGQHGVRIAQLTDYILANLILTGSTAGSQNWVNFDDGKTYVLTFDGQPLYGSHSLGGSTFNNIITGNLPTTIAALNAQDIAVTVNQLQQAVSQIIQFVSTITDDTGATLFPDFDPAEQLTLMVPPCLAVAADLFEAGGTIGGTSGSSSGATTNIGRKIVKNIVRWNLLGGCENVMSGGPAITGTSGARFTPPNPTTFWWSIDSDLAKGFYFQRFMPLPTNETIPLGEDPNAQAARYIAAMAERGVNVRPEDADVYAAAEVSTDFSAIGANANRNVIEKEEFFVSSRTRQFVYPGPWFCNGQVDPVGTSN